MLLQVPVGQVDDGCVLQIFFPDYFHSQLLRKTIDSRDQGNEGGIYEHDRRDEDDDADERKSADGNHALVVSRLHTITTPKYSMGALIYRNGGPLRVEHIL